MAKIYNIIVLLVPHEAISGICNRLRKGLYSKIITS